MPKNREESLKRIFDNQKRIESALLDEVKRLRVITSKQKRLLDSWKPIVEEYIENHRLQNEILSDDNYLAELLGLEEATRDLNGSLSRRNERNLFPTYPSEQGATIGTESTGDVDMSGSTDSYIVPNESDWLVMSSPATPSNDSKVNERVLRQDRHETYSDLKCSKSAIDKSASDIGTPDMKNSNGTYRSFDTATSSFSGEKYSPGYGNIRSSSKFHSKNERDSNSSNSNTPFREILSLFTDPNFNGRSMSHDLNKKSSRRIHFSAETPAVGEADRYDRTTNYSNPSSYHQRYNDKKFNSPSIQSNDSDLSDCDKIQADLMNEVNNILKNSPRKHMYFN